MTSKDDAANEKKWETLEKKAISQLVEAASVGKGWEFYSEGSTGIKVYTFVNADGTKGVCGKAMVEAPPHRILAEVSNTANWKSWDSLLDNVEVRPFAPRFKIIHLTFTSWWPISPRDVVYFETTHKATDGSVMLATCEMEYNDFPVTDSYVRATLHGGGWHIRPVPSKTEKDTTKCEVTYFMNTDPKLAIIPTWVMNLAVTRFPSIIDKVRDAIRAAPAAATTNSASTKAST